MSSGPAATFTTEETVTFFPDLKKPARPTAARPVSPKPAGWQAESAWKTESESEDFWRIGDEPAGVSKTVGSS